MKTIFRNLTGLIIAVLLLAPGERAWSQSDKGFFTISGIVKERGSQKRLEYSVVALKGSNVGTIANANGEFSIKIKEGTDSKAIIFSHLGYSNFELPIDGTSKNDITIFLDTKTSLLDPVTIIGMDGRAIVERAIEKIGTNYSSKNGTLSGFYRETVKKRRSYINVSEAVVEIFKTPYGDGVERDAVQVYKGRKLVSPDPKDTLMVKLLGGPNLSIYLDIVKNPDLILSKENLAMYSFTLEESVTIGERAHYVVSFQPQVIMPYALYYGKLFIDKESFTFSRAEYRLSMNDKGKATMAILKRKPFGMHFKPEEVSFLVTYRESGGVALLHYIRSEINFRCDWKKRLFSTSYSIVSENVITDAKMDEAKKISGRLAFKDSHSLSDKVNNFSDENFWEDYNIIEPDESLENAVNRLRKAINKN
ncbi:carboxypeptidase-like regulatory domain-containing protein [Bacteroidales bacterium]